MILSFRHAVLAGQAVPELREPVKVLRTRLIAIHPLIKLQEGVCTLCRDLGWDSTRCTT